MCVGTAFWTTHAVVCNYVYLVSYDARLVAVLCMCAAGQTDLPKKVDICPQEDVPGDCFYETKYLNSMFCQPPCTAGGGYGPCEVISPNQARLDEPLD